MKKLDKHLTAFWSCVCKSVQMNWSEFVYICVWTLACQTACISLCISKIESIFRVRAAESVESLIIWSHFLLCLCISSPSTKYIFSSPPYFWEGNSRICLHFPCVVSACGHCVWGCAKVPLCVSLSILGTGWMWECWQGIHTGVWLHTALNPPPPDHTQRPVESCAWGQALSLTQLSPLLVFLS